MLCAIDRGELVNVADIGVDGGGGGGSCLTGDVDNGAGSMSADA